MTDLEKELTRQIHELSNEMKVLRERIAVLEYRTNGIKVPQPPLVASPYPNMCGSTGIAGRD